VLVGSNREAITILHTRSRMDIPSEIEGARVLSVANLTMRLPRGERATTAAASYQRAVLVSIATRRSVPMTLLGLSRTTV